jgi:hypothetical protein
MKELTDMFSFPTIEPGRILLAHFLWFEEKRILYKN